MPPYMLPPTLQQLQADAFTKIYRKGVASSMFCSSKWLECLQIMGHDLCASVEMEMFGLVFDCYGWSAMICTSRVPYCAHLWTFVNCFVSIYRCFFACERCMMYDTIFQARIRQFLSGDPPSNQHPMSQLPDVTTGVAWTLFTVWTRVLPPFSPSVGWWIHFSKWLKVVDKYVEECDFMHKITHMYIIYKWFIAKIQHVIDVHIIGSLYQLIQLVFLASLGSSSRDILVDEKHEELFG